MSKLFLVSVLAVSSSVLVAAADVTIYKIDSPKKGDCGESQCPAGVAHFPVTFGGYKEGNCADAGYTVADGTSEFKVPVWGKTVDIKLFKKPSDVQAGGDVTIYKIDSPKKGDCGESLCPAAVAHFPVTFGGYKEGNCADAGYTVADGTSEFKVPVWGKTVEIKLFKKSSDVQAGGDVTIYKIDSPKKGDCGESLCPAAVAHFPVTFGGYKEGNCADAGYTVADGTSEFKVPVWGKTVEIKLFKKPSDVQAGGDVTIYKIDSPKKGDCGESLCPAAVAHFPVTFGGYKEGNCADAGYTVADGTSEFKVPVWGKTVEIKLFKKPLGLEAGGNVTIYKIDSPKKGDCGESLCPAAVAHFPVTFGGYKEGKCADAGYTVADGTSEFKVPVWGKTVEINLYKKPVQDVFMV